MSEENKAIVRRFYEEVNKGNLAVVNELIGPDFVLHHPLSPAVVRGPEGFKDLLAQLRTALPDLEINADDLIAEGDKVAASFTVRGTHRGVLLGVPPTGRRVMLTGVAVYRITGGQIVEDRVAEDLLALMRQLGREPTPGQS